MGLGFFEVFPAFMILQFCDCSAPAWGSQHPTAHRFPHFGCCHRASPGSSLPSRRIIGHAAFWANAVGCYRSSLLGLSEAERHGHGKPFPREGIAGELEEGRLEETRKQRTISFPDKARTIKGALRALNIKMHQRGKPDENRSICLGEMLLSDMLPSRLWLRMEMPSGSRAVLSNTVFAEGILKGSLSRETPSPQ